MTYSRRIVLLLTIFASMATSLAIANAADKAPNILFIYSDDHSHRTVGCYPESYDWVKTPHMDNLAKQGVRFTHAY
ncbi:MAG: hypothetical protein ABGX07_01360, partial [Pirellulaceae bacterium]